MPSSSCYLSACSSNWKMMLRSKSGARIQLKKNILGEFIRELRNASDLSGLQKALGYTTGLFFTFGLLSKTHLLLFLSPCFVSSCHKLLLKLNWCLNSSFIDILGREEDTVNFVFTYLLPVQSGSFTSWLSQFISTIFFHWGMCCEEAFEEKSNAIATWEFSLFFPFYQYMSIWSTAFAGNCIIALLVIKSSTT